MSFGRLRIVKVRNVCGRDPFLIDLAHITNFAFLQYEPYVSKNFTYL